MAGDNTKGYILQHLTLPEPLNVEDFRIDTTTHFKTAVKTFLAEEKTFQQQMQMLREYETAWRTSDEPYADRYAGLFESAFIRLKYISMGKMRFHQESQNLETEITLKSGTELFMDIFEEHSLYIDRVLDYSEILLKVDELLGKAIHEREFLMAAAAIDTQVQRHHYERQEWDLRMLLPLPVKRLYQYAAFLSYLRAKVMEQDDDELKNMVNKWHAKIMDLVTCIAQIYHDTKSLRAIEELQNKISNLPDYFLKKDKGELGYIRTDLRHFGRLLVHGIVSDNRYLILLEDLLVICRPQQKHPNDQHTLKFDSVMEVHDVRNYKLPYQEFMTVTLHDDFNKQQEITVQDPDTIPQWTAALNELRKYIRIKGFAQEQLHIPKTMTVPLASRCDVCEEMFKGSFQQAIVCVHDFEGGSKGCTKTFHSDCIAKSRCRRNGRFMHPALGLEPWNAGSTARAQVPMILGQLPIGTFVFHAQQNATELGQKFYLSIAVPKQERTRFLPAFLESADTKLTVVVEHEVEQREDGDYVITTLEQPLIVPDLQEFVDDYKKNNTVNLGTKHQPYRGGLKLAWWESIRRKLRQNGCLFYDWMYTKENIDTLHRFNIISLKGPMQQSLYVPRPMKQKFD